MALIFQSNPEQWDIRRHLLPNKKVLWYVRNYKTLMKAGDLVLFWSAQGDQAPTVRGFYGWGIATDGPITDSEGDDRLPVNYVERWVKQSEASTSNLERTAPIPFAKVAGLKTWEDHLLIRSPQGSTFIASPDQVDELYREGIRPSLPDSQLGKALKTVHNERALSLNDFVSREITTKEGKL